MSRRSLLTRLCCATALLFAQAASAHNPICFCYMESDSEVLCEGGFTDGASAEGVSMQVVDDRGRVLIAGAINEEQVFVFEMPDVEFQVVFDAGDNHRVVVYQDEIE